MDPLEVTQDNYLAAVAPTVADVNLTMSEAFERHRWTTRMNDRDFEENAKIFLRVIHSKDDASVKAHKLLESLEKVGWDVDWEEPEYPLIVAREVIAEGEKRAKHHGRQFKAEVAEFL